MALQPGMEQFSGRLAFHREKSHGKLDVSKTVFFETTKKVAISMEDY